MADFDPQSFIAANNPGSAPVDQVQVNQFDPKDFINQNTIAKQSALQEQFGSTPQQILAGIEAVARGASLGTSDYLETRSGLSTPEAIRGRMQANPVTSFAGNVAGATGLSAFTGGLGGLAEAGIAGSIGEGALFGGANVISDAALGDPNLNAQKVLADVGMGAALGGGIGVLSKALGALPAILRKGPEAPVSTEVAATGALSPSEALKEAGLGKEVPLTAAEQGAKFGAPNGGDLRASFPIDALEASDQKPIVEGLNNLKSNADEILAAGQDLGAPVPEGMLSDDEHIQKLDFALTNSPSPQGIARNRLYNSGYDSASKSVSNALGEGSDLSLAQTGNQAKEALSNAFEAKYEPIRQMYSQIETLAPEVPIPDSAKLGQSLKGIIEDKGLIKGTPEHSFVNTFADGLEQVDNLQKLKNYRTALQRATGPETRYVSGLIKDELDDLERNSILAYADKIEDPVAKEEINNLVGQVWQAKNVYSGFRDEMEKVGKVLWGGKKIYGAQDFLDKIESETPEKFATRLFSKNNSESLQWMNQNFPEVTRMLSQFEKSKLRSSSMVKGDFSPVKFFNNLDKIAPEVKEVMFTPEELSKFKSGKIYFDNFLPNFNPSGTAGAEAYHDFIRNPKLAALNWIKDFGVEKFIKGSVNLSPEQMKAAQLQADQALKLKGIYGIANRISNEINANAKQIFTAGKGGALAGATYLTDREYDRISNKVKSYYSNPETLMNDMASNTENLYHAAPGITQSIHSAMMQAISFLNSKLPQAQNNMPLSQDFEPTKTQKATFNQYYHAVNDPLHALKQVKNGTLSNETMEALEAVHPHLLQEARQKVMEHMDIEKAKKLSYSQKLSLAKFIGQPLDVNMTPAAIQSNQISFNMPRQSQQSTPQQGRKAPLGGLKQLDFSNRSGTETQRKEEQ
jgi:hypothetical protein